MWRRLSINAVNSLYAKCQCRHGHDEHLWYMSCSKGLFTLKVRLHVPSPFPSLSAIVKFTLTDIMGSEPNLYIKWSVTIGTMINFDSDGAGHGHGDGTCECAFNVNLTTRCVSGNGQFDGKMVGVGYLWTQYESGPLINLGIFHCLCRSGAQYLR